MVDGIRPVAPAAGPASRQAPAPGFDSLLQEKLKISAHAQTRLPNGLGPEQMRRLAGAMQEAARKGASQSLVLMGDTALIVSVKNGTVITALGPERQQGDTVITGIDSAVIIR